MTKKKKEKPIQQEIEEGVEEVFEKMDKPFHEYFGECTNFCPDCHGCEANLMWTNFKYKFWKELVRK